MSPDFLAGIVIGIIGGAFGVALIPCYESKRTGDPGPRPDKPHNMLRNEMKTTRIGGVQPPAADMPRLEFYSEGGMILSRCAECKGVKEHAPECSYSGIYQELEADPDLMGRPV